MKTAWSLRFACVLAGMSLAGAGASETAAVPAACVVTREGDQMVTLGNGLVMLRFDLKQKSFSLTDERNGELVFDQAWMLANKWALKKRADWTVTTSDEAVNDKVGKGRRLVFEISQTSKDLTQPVYLFSYTLHEGQGVVEMGFGLRNPRDYALRLMAAEPLNGARWFAGKQPQQAQTLNGSAGSETARVTAGAGRKSHNSLMLTALIEGRRRTVVWGGLCYGEFARVAESSKDAVLTLGAEDPLGRLVDPGQSWWAADTSYLDVTTADPFLALEQYGRALRVANNARPNVYDFPTLCGWSVGMMSKLPNINNSKLLVGELEAAQKCGLTKYTKVGIRLEPDTYCWMSNGNTQQGWWDDAHWAKYGHLVPPYETFAKWCAAIRERDGIPYTYFQMGMPSDDYARAFPGHMLFNDISRLALLHNHHQPLVSFDYTDPDFQKHVSDVWQRLRRDGIRGVKFDYPETAWRPEGGFENRYATTAFAYREAFRLAREGLGPEAFLDERNLGESGRPCLDVTAGLVDTQRNWTDSNKYQPQMVSISGLRWYKNRTVFNYFPDTKTVHDVDPKMRQSMLTMMFLTSGRLDLATSFTLFTPAITRDFSRIYPAYREPFTARPLDAFTRVYSDPQIYDLELTPDWHQVALFNSSTKPGTVNLPLSGDRVTTGAVGLDPAATYYVYDFWRDELVGKVPGTATVKRELGPSLCAMLSVRKAQGNPQVLSTSRHILQGWVDLADVKWDAASKTLSGVAKVIGGEPFKIVLAGNGLTAKKPSAQGGEARLESHPAGADYSVLVLERPENGDVAWNIQYK